MFDNLEIENLSDIDFAIIQYVNQNLDTVRFMRVRDLALATHVSPSTIIRFVNRVGYATFADFKLKVQDKYSQLEHGVRRSKINAKIDDSLSFEEDFYEKIMTAYQEIEQASLVYCVGLGSSKIMGNYMARKLNTTGYASIAIEPAEFPIVSNERILDPNIVLILFSTSGETKELINLLQMVNTHPKEKRPKTISITNTAQNRVSKMSDLNIPYHINQDRLTMHIDLTSQLPVLYIIELLLSKFYFRTLKPKQK